MKYQKKILQLSVIAAVLGTSTLVLSSGFKLNEQSIADLGQAHSGGAAIAEDATTGFYNPAGLVRLKRMQAVLGLTLISIDSQYNGFVTNTTTLSTTLNYGRVISGGIMPVPNFALAIPMNQRVVAGLTVTAPFGLQTDWSNNSIVSPAATRSSLSVIDISPSIGVAISDQFSIGVGIDCNQLKAELDQQAAPLFVGTNSGISNNIANDLGIGWHIGALYQSPTMGTRLGLNYSSSVKYNLTGISTFTPDFVDIGQVYGPAIDPTLNSAVTFPATTTASIFQPLNSQWDVLGTVVLTQWSQFDRTIVLNNVTFFSGTLFSFPVLLPQNFHDTWSFAGGINYHATPNVTVRSGIQFDPTPTNDIDRSIRLPDGDRIALSIGTHIKAGDHIGIDVAYEHLFSKGVPITSTSNVGPALAQQVTTLNGSSITSGDLIGLGINWDI